MKAFGYCAFFALMGSPLVGRVGETAEQLMKRFGPPSSRGIHRAMAQGRSYDLGPTFVFRQNDWEISCDLVDGRCVRIIFTKIGEWTEEHFQTVLNANSQGEKWTEDIKPGLKQMAREWKRRDGAIANWASRGGMTITVPAYERAKSIAEAKAKAAAGKPAKI